MWNAARFNIQHWTFIKCAILSASGQLNVEKVQYSILKMRYRHQGGVFAHVNMPNVEFEVFGGKANGIFDHLAGFGES